MQDVSECVSRPCSQCPEGASKCLASQLKMQCLVLYIDQLEAFGFGFWLLGVGSKPIGDTRADPRKRTVSYAGSSPSFKAFVFQAVFRTEAAASSEHSFDKDRFSEQYFNACKTVDGQNPA